MRTFLPFFVGFFFFFFSPFFPLHINFFACLIRSLVTKTSKITYIDKKPFSRLAEGFEELVPTPAFVDAAGSSRVGDALRILVPHLFSSDDLRLPSIKDLTGTKVSALIGELSSIVCLPSHNVHLTATQRFSKFNHKMISTIFIIRTLKSQL